LVRKADIGSVESSASMASAVVIGKVRLAGVIVRTEYGEGGRADYPNLAGKVNLHAYSETTRFSCELSHS
jgi:hypothetical protein